MPVPMITANYLAILALLYTVLALQVMRLRQGNRADFGDGDSASLRSAIRVHANFAEYVPIIALMVALLEMSGASALRVHVLMGPAGFPPAPSARHVRQTEYAAILDRPRRRHRDHDRPFDRFRPHDPDPVRVWRHKLKFPHNSLKQQPFA